MSELENVNDEHLICYHCAEKITQQEQPLNGFYDTCSVCGETTFVTKPEVFGLNFLKNTNGKVFVVVGDKWQSLYEIEEG